MIDLFKTHKKSNDTGKIILGAITGAAVGFTAGILTAPRTGKETREILSSKAAETVEKAAETIDKQKAKVTERITKAKD